MFSPENNRLLENSRKCYSFKYRIRCFSSKGAALVLGWNILVSATVWYLFKVYSTLASGFINSQSDFNLLMLHFIKYVLFGVLNVVCAPLSGWLADARFGNYRVFKAGLVFVFFASVVACLGVLLLKSSSALSNSNVAFAVSAVTVPLVYFLTFAGSAACLVTALQLGLDQMPDGTTASITSFIAWDICSMYTGIWLKNGFSVILPDCVSSSGYHCNLFQQIFSIFPVLSMAIALCLDFLLSSKWLTIEPKSSQSLKVIFQVLKFAAKHKAPVQRSAFTYWEDDIPSRIDLGKSKYGGPFTTEQVENVKTILKLLVISIPMFIVMLSLSFQDFPLPENALSQFTYNRYWCVILGTLVFEFFVYPIAKNRLPSILQRIGIASFFVVLVKIVFLVLTVVDSTLSTTVWHNIILQVVTGVLMMVLLPADLEFMCAQSPYDMRALVTGYGTLAVISPMLIGYLLQSFLSKFCTAPYCPVIHDSIVVVLAVIGFLLHCILARWYKKRVRDDIFPPHVVEEVFDRRLSAQS